MGSGHKERSGYAGIVLFVIIYDQGIIFTEMYNSLSIKNLEFHRTDSNNTDASWESPIGAELTKTNVLLRFIR